MSIAESIARFTTELKGTESRLVAVSKTKPVELILEAYHAGQLDFGENKVQELREKPDQLPADIRWHMIGHLQTNKVKYIASFIHLIHAVDSLKLLKEINKQAQKHDRTIDCLLQIHIAQEEHKFGLTEEDLEDLLNSDQFKVLHNINIRGLMGMATYTDDMELVRKEFRYLRKLFEDVKAKFSLPNVAMNELSMGMSDDYAIALEEGSTLIRVGSKIFGPRIYQK